MACPLQKSWFFEPTKRLEPHDNVMMRFHVMQCLLGWVFMCLYAVAEHAMLYSLNRTHFTEHNNVTICHPYCTAITLGCQTSLHHKPDESNTSQMKGQARPGNLLSAMSVFVREITWLNISLNMSNIAQMWEFWAGKIHVKIINFHSFTPHAQAYNQLRRTQRKPFQLTWILYCHVLPYVAYASFNDLQGALVSFKASMKGGAAQATGPAEFPKAWTIWPWKFGTSLFSHFFRHMSFQLPRPCRLDTKSVYSWII